VRACSARRIGTPQRAQGAGRPGRRPKRLALVPAVVRRSESDVAPKLPLSRLHQALKGLVSSGADLPRTG